MLLFFCDSFLSTMHSLLSQSGSDFALGDVSSTSGGGEMASKAGQQSGHHIEFKRMRTYSGKIRLVLNSRPVDNAGSAGGGPVVDVDVDVEGDVRVKSNRSSMSWGLLVSDFLLNMEVVR